MDVLSYVIGGVGTLLLLGYCALVYFGVIPFPIISTNIDMLIVAVCITALCVGIIELVA